MNKEKGWPRVGKTVFLTREAAQDAPKGGADHGTQRTNRPAAPDVCGDWQSGLHGLWI